VDCRTDVWKSVESGTDVFRGIFRAALRKSLFQSSSRPDIEGEEIRCKNVDV
jgi:hypothetical protein